MQTNLVEGGKYVTTIQISNGLRYAIKNSGMSISGALLKGWVALEEQKQWKEEMRNLQTNMERYRKEWIQLKYAERERSKVSAAPVGSVEGQR